MIIIKCKPTSPGYRNKIKIINNKIQKVKPYKKLLITKKKTGGRNNRGRITTRHIGGGHKQKYRLIDFKRKYNKTEGIIQNIEYDPNRSANIALIIYKNGTKSYIIASKNMKKGYKISSKKTNTIIEGNSMPLYKIPSGTIIHNIEIKPGKGGQLSRAAGSYSQIISHNKKYTNIRLKSNEIRRILSKCKATIGKVGNKEHMLQKLGKAGTKRNLGIRPTTRGTAMNPIDHPHGGGEGKNFGKHPVTPWGQKTKGKKTRKNKRTNKFIINKNKKK